MTNQSAIATTETIEYTTTTTSLGQLLVAISSKGVCAVLIGSDIHSLVGDLHRRFFAAKLVRQACESMPYIRTIATVIESPTAVVDVPLDLRGSEFAKSVWGALRAIPVGSTATYKQIAQKIGAGALAKDVGEACAANALAVIVPCHRVIRSDGSLGGYRWGLRRKQLLLDREKDAAGFTDDVREHTDRINWLFGQAI